MKSRWINSLNISLFILLLVWSCPTIAQNSREVNKGLEKGAKEVLKTPVKVPGIDLEMAGAKGLSLALAVNEAINLTLKESLKSDLWNTDNLSTSELMQVQTSTTPVTTYFDFSPTAGSFEELLKTNLSQLNVPQMLAEMGNDMGFYFSGSADDYMVSVRDSLIASLDNAAQDQFAD